MVPLEAPYPDVYTDTFIFFLRSLCKIIWMNVHYFPNAPRIIKALFLQTAVNCFPNGLVKVYLWTAIASNINVDASVGILGRNSNVLHRLSQGKYKICILSKVKYTHDKTLANASATAKNDMKNLASVFSSILKAYTNRTKLFPSKPTIKIITQSNVCGHKLYVYLPLYSSTTCSKLSFHILFLLLIRRSVLYLL